MKFADAELEGWPGVEEDADVMDSVLVYDLRRGMEGGGGG